jgi:Cof subfamily protein (haloacid dehalogenase superfamily)
LPETGEPSPRISASTAGELPYGLVVLDVDGTLLDPSGSISLRVREAVHAARDAGCLIALASGRRLWAIRPVIEALGFSLPVILYNGAILYDLDGETLIVDQHLQAETLCASLEVLWNHNYQPVLYGHPSSGELVYTGPEHRDTAAIRHYFDRPTTQPRRLDLESLRGLERVLLLAAMGDEMEMRALDQCIKAQGLDCSTLVERQSFVARSGWWQLDISATGCSKGLALRRLCDLYGIPLSRTLAIGDGINDLDLLESVGLGVAMGNAVPEILQAAQCRVSDNARDGVAEAIERFVLGGLAMAEAPLASV